MLVLLLQPKTVKAVNQSSSEDGNHQHKSEKGGTRIYMCIKIQIWLKKGSSIKLKKLGGGLQNGRFLLKVCFYQSQPHGVFLLSKST